MTAVHNDGCQRQYLLTVNPTTRKLSYMPTFRGRWDCPACLEHKFGKKFAHIVQRHKRLVAGVIEPDSHLSRQANRVRSGYMSITHPDMTSRTLVTTRRLKPDWQELPSLHAVLGVFENCRVYGVTRMTYNNLWRPENDPTGIIHVETKSVSWKDAEAILERAGFKDKQMGSVPVDEVVNRLLAARDPGVGSFK